MGKAGPPPRSNHLKMLEGVRDDRVNHDEPIPGEGIIVPPVGLSVGAQMIWNRLAPDLVEKRVLTSWDADEFANGCRIQALLNEALTLAERSPIVSAGSNDNLVMNPAIRAVTSLEAALRSIWSRFGLTPGDRAQLKVSDDNGSKQNAGRLIV